MTKIRGGLLVEGDIRFQPGELIEAGSIRELFEKVKKLEDDICEAILLGDTPQHKNKALTVEEYLESPNKL